MPPTKYSWAPVRAAASRSCLVACSSTARRRGRSNDQISMSSIAKRHPSLPCGSALADKDAGRSACHGDPSWSASHDADAQPIARLTGVRRPPAAAGLPSTCCSRPSLRWPRLALHDRLSLPPQLRDDSGVAVRRESNVKGGCVINAAVAKKHKEGIVVTWGKEMKVIGTVS